MCAKTRVQYRRSVRRSSLRTTLFFESFGLLALTVLAVSVVAFFLSWNELKIRTTAQLQSIVESKEALLESTISKQRENVSRLARNPLLKDLTSVTTLAGFEQLVTIDENGNTKVLAGTVELMPLMREFLKTTNERSETIVYPIIAASGWTQYIIAAPSMNGAVRQGTLIATFDVTEFASQILQTDSAAQTSEVILAIMVDHEAIVLRRDRETGRVVPVYDTAEETLSIVREALSGREGIGDTADYAGVPVLAAYRSIPSLGWAVIAKVDLYEVRAPTLRLATNLAGISLMIIVLLSLSTFLVGRRIVGPLEELTQKLDGLEAKRWKFKQSIFTGNELEIVDNAADELTKRLRVSHEHLESLVAQRTKELQKQHAQDAAILQSMDDGLIVTDEAGRITYINQMAGILTGYTGGIGAIAQDILVIADKNGSVLDRAHHPITHVLVNGTALHPSTDPQLTVQKPDGLGTALHIRVTPILRGKKCIGSVAVMRDVTEERRIDHMKSEFITLVSHQLRTPLSTMRWYLEMLLTDDEGPLNTDQREYASQVAISNARMVHLVNALLNVSKIELGKFQISAETIDLQKLVRDTASSFDLELRERKIELVLDMTKKDIGIRSDRDLLGLILENLLSNAIKYSHPDTKVTVALREDSVSQTVLMTVKDTGIGIPDIQKQDIGQKLFRAANAKNVDTDGNGLGLYISHVAAETIDATLTFESVEGEGTTFSLVIPLDPKKHS